MQRMLSMTGGLSAITTLLLLMVASSPTSAEDQGATEQLIRSEFKELSLRHRNDVAILEVCFDLCDVFQWRGSPHSKEAWDFVAVYEYKRGVGKESKRFMMNGKPVVLGAVGQLAPLCEEDKSDAQAPYECSWAALAKKKAIRVGSSAYDEGQRCFGWRDLNSSARPNRAHCTSIKQPLWDTRR